MKTLFLLRHAQALSADGHSDAERQLSPKGQGDARALGRVMKDKGYQPEHVYCSTAVRTRMTLDLVLESLEKPKTDYEQKLYDGTQGDYFSFIQNTGESIASVLLVGHNPVVHALAASLAKEDGSAALTDLTNGYAPGTLSVFKVESWAGLQPYENQIKDLLDPVQYNGADRPTRWM